MRLPDSLALASPAWWLPVLLLLAASTGLLVRGYRGASIPGSVRAMAAGLKALGITLLSICLLEPIWSQSRAQPGANLFVILADNSQSLTLRAGETTETRGDQLRPVLGDQNADWQLRLQREFEVRRFLFDDHLRRAGDFSELNFQGRASRLQTALSQLDERLRGRPIAGVLLFTDGNATDVANGTMDVTGLPPVYSVLMDWPDTQRDLAIRHVSVTQTAFEDAPIALQAEVACAGLAGQTIVAQLLDESGVLRNEETAPAPADDRPLVFRFSLRPPRPGVSFYTLRVSGQAQLDPFDRPETSVEATLANNYRLIAVDRGKGPYRILYVAGRPNWEFRFLRRALESDETIQLVALLRIARREPRFDFRGRTGENANPLYRGFGNVDRADVEQYDQPVFVRLGTRDPAELRGGFPKTRQDLFTYHALILDDVEAEFFTHEQLALIQAFVVERGGGFLMLGGQESFQAGNFARTPVADVLPVYLDRMPGQKAHERFRLALTRDGWLQPWVRLRDNETDERKRLEAMPDFQTVNRLGAIKPGATVLATVSDSTGASYPALVAHRYGTGRAAALAVGDWWRWALRQDPSDQDLTKAWRQMLRWLVADVPDRIQVTADADSEHSSHTTRIAVRLRDPQFRPLENASVHVTVRPTRSEPIQLKADPAPDEAGLYLATYTPHTNGVFRADVTATDEAGQQVGNTETGWTVNPPVQEFARLAPNTALLASLATQTGGAVVRLGDLSQFVRELATRPAPVAQVSSTPLWHSPWVLMLAFGCLIGEWTIRRSYALP